MIKQIALFSSFFIVVNHSSAQVGIGTTNPTNTLEITNGTAGQSGLRFSNLNSSSAVSSDTSSKLLAVDASGDVVVSPINNFISKTGSYTAATPSNSTIVIGEIECRYKGATVGAPASGPQVNLEFRSSSASTLNATSCGYERYQGGIGSSTCTNVTLNTNSGAFTELAAGGLTNNEILIYTLVTATGSIYEITLMDRAGTQWYIWAKRIK
ncbi:hypothetical protein [Flavobacterium sp.]|uniref:hypothetical protein n=1 Tax=Flavobacterium sp. TaxID=239 RepID=UPI003D0BD0C4